ncbi:MAG: aminotransferase class III-fold pyridoxal phosphate-dependent enzyme [Acidimicrobiales bacterium]
MKQPLIGGVLGAAQPIAVRAEGVWLYDSGGKAYLDGCSGAVVSNLGHGEPRILEAMASQAQRLSFAHRGSFANEPALQLAERLCDLSGYPHVMLANSGSEATETAMRLALQYWQEQGKPRSTFLAHEVGYHGATAGALSVSGNAARRAPAEAMLHDFNQLIPPYYYRFAGPSESEPAFGLRLVDAARRKIDRDCAAVIVEPVGGAAGSAITPPSNYLAGLAKVCAEQDTLFIADEVMCGLGRTGTLLAVEHWDVRPDLVVLGKGLGAGYAPVSAVLVSARVHDTIHSGSGVIANGHTYGGNPLGCAAANAALGILIDDCLIPEVVSSGQHLRAGLVELMRSHSIIGEVRGEGLLLGVELVADRETKATFSPVGSLGVSLATAAQAHGLMLYPANGGVNDAVIVAPPFTSSTSELDDLLDRLDNSLSSLA